MAALATCAITAAALKNRTSSQPPPPVHPGQPPPAGISMMIPLTIPETARLLAATLSQPAPPGHAKHWQAWRRRHQARARWYHQRARLSRNCSLVS
jgi:hypothetical protein